jgi:hypothetical protein
VICKKQTTRFVDHQRQQRYRALRQCKNLAVNAGVHSIQGKIRLLSDLIILNFSKAHLL